MDKITYLSRRFILWRKTDVHTISGTGKVAEGLVLPDGQCVIQWTTTTGSIGLYRNFEELLDIHGHGKCTVIRWIDEPTNQVRSS